jgi:CBS domain-containing protein
VKTLLTRDTPTIERGQSIQEAAKIMAEDNVSSLLIIDPDFVRDEDDPQSPVLGIVTDRDLCARVLAEGLSPHEDVATVMTTEVISLDHNAYIYEAMLKMLRYNVHHLPVVKDQQPIGIIETTDIVRYESQNSLLLVSSIFHQHTIEELAAVAEEVKSSFVRLVNEDANSHMVGSAMSVIGRSFKQRLLEMAEEKLGPPPVPYCFLALGSMGRDEQLLVTDQDNAIILDESYQESKHGKYFEELAQFVSDGLDACGYKYCTGDIMATNPMWRMTRSQWEECFADWIDDPNPKALLNASIFFDLDGVYGRLKWAEQLTSFIVRRARKNNRFLACLARNALNRTPPLGFFKSFVVEKDGQHKNSINLKRRGTAPLVDLIRVHALAVGSRTQNSFERLDDIIDAGILPKGRAQDLKDALEFISMVRIRHQAYDVEMGIEPDNNIEPENLSDFERRNLKDAFQILSNGQNFLKFRYQANKSFK